MNQLSPEAKRLLKLARNEDEPDAPVLNRVESALALRIAAGVGVVTAGAVVTKAGAGASLLGNWVKVVTVVGIAASVAGGGAWVARSLPHSRWRDDTVANISPRRPTVTIAPPGALHTDTTIRSAPTAEAEPTSAVRNASAADGSQVKVRSSPAIGAAASADSPDPLHAEIRDLRAAQQALRAGEALRVLSLLDQQDAKYPSGILQEERSAARVFALCQSGRVSEARKAAKRFEHRWPKSSLVARVRSSCWTP